MVYIRIYTFMLLCISFQGKSVELKTLTVNDVSIQLEIISEALKLFDFNTLSNERNRAVFENFKSQKLPFYKEVHSYLKMVPDILYKSGFIKDINLYLIAYSDLFCSVNLTKIDDSTHVETYLQKIEQIDQEILGFLQPIYDFLEKNRFTGGPPEALKYAINILKKTGP